MMSAPVLANAGAPSSRSKPHHALEAASIVSVTASVGIVLRYGGAPQIVPAVVRGIPVAMIDHARAPFTGHVQPGEPVCAVAPAINSNVPVAARRVQISSKVADVNRSARPLEPTKFSGRGIVMQ